MTEYTKQEARRMLVHYHNLDGNENLQQVDGVRRIMNKIGSIQYDPLNVVGRNADLVLQARVHEYKPEHLSYLLYEEHCLTDGFDKEMCIYNTKDFEKFAKIREAQEQSIIRVLNYRGQLEALDILDEVRAFVSENGQTGTKDISIGEVRESRWGHKKLSSAALDYLYNKGEICVSNKKGTQKYFDLTERVIPSEYIKNFNFMTINDFLDWYIKRRISTVGMLWDKRGGAWQGHYLGDNDLRKDTLNRLAERGHIGINRIEGIENIFYTCEDFHVRSESERKKDYARFVAPLDNIMWDRTMLEKIFDFFYSWEVYIPVNKRKYGYYVIPVLYNDQFVARFEPLPLKEKNCFAIKSWWWETGVKPDDNMISVILQEMERFSGFLGTDNFTQNSEIIRGKGKA